MCSARQIESIVLVEGVIKPADVKGCTIKDCEIQIYKIHVIVEVSTRLPFGVEEASKTEEEYAKVGRLVKGRVNLAHARCRRTRCSPVSSSTRAWTTV